MPDKRKVKVVGRDLPAISERCPKCAGPLAEALAGELYCKACKLQFERDGEGGRVREVELWEAGTFPRGGGDGEGQEKHDSGD